MKPTLSVATCSHGTRFEGSIQAITLGSASVAETIDTPDPAPADSGRLSRADVLDGAIDRCAKMHLRVPFI